MIGYVTLGSDDVPRAAQFYDELLTLIGAKRFYEGENFVAWSTGPGAPGISVITPFDGNPASVGNGTMIAIAVDSPEKVQEMHAKAIELGGTDEGAPGARGGNFFAGYFRDLDGNKLNAFSMVEDDS